MTTDQDWADYEGLKGPYKGNGRDPAHEPTPLDVTDPTLFHGHPVPERRWMVDGWMPWRNTTALYGDGGMGKSLLAQMLATSAATGQAWLGLSVAKCRVLGVFCEDDGDELHRRQADINAAMGISFAALPDFRWISRVGFDNLLMTFEAGRLDGVGVLTAFWHQITEAAKDFHAQLVILDTAADTFGGNENARPQVRQFIQRACTHLAADIEGAVLLCAHPSLSGMASGEGSGGSTAWNNSVRSRMFLSRPPAEDAETPIEEGARVLTKKKSNYGSSGDTIELQWQKGFLHVRRTHSVCMVDRIEERFRAEAAEKAFLAALKALTAENRSCSDSKTAPNFAPKMLTGRPESKGFKRNELRDAMERLFQAGKIRARQEIGRSANRHRLFGIAPVEPNGLADEPAEAQE